MFALLWNLRGIANLLLSVVGGKEVAHSFVLTLESSDPPYVSSAFRVGLLSIPSP